MGMQELVKNIDRGLYRDAAAAKMTAVQFLAAKAGESGVAPEGDEWKQRLARFHKQFGTDNGRATANAIERVQEFAWDSYALEKLLAESGIVTRGNRASTVEKVFALSTSTVLFPAFIDSQVVAGLLAQSLVPQLVAAEVMVDQHTADHTSMAETAADRSTSKSGEGARATSVTITTADRSIKLGKFMGQLLASYEVIRLQRLNLIGVFMQRLGAQIGIDETDELIQVAIAGDGNSGSAVVDTDADVTGVLDYDEVIKLLLSFDDGYEFRHAVINDTNIRTILNMAEFKDPTAGFTFQKSGRAFEDRVGAIWHRWNSTGSSAFSTDRILAIDDRYALVQYTEGGVLTESDKLIDRQFERIVVSKWTGFGKLDYNATQCLDITT